MLVVCELDARRERRRRDQPRAREPARKVVGPHFLVGLPRRDKVVLRALGQPLVAHPTDRVLQPSY